jgi:SAM-dependent methyltransferase
MAATYDPLAPHYDAVAGDGVAEAAFLHDLIGQRRLIEPHPGRAVTLLDVACGTGAIAASLARGYQGGYQVSGLDISSGMLAVARAKLPAGTPLYQADMTSFRLDARFDVVVCAYQGVNHLLGFPAWESFFRCVYEHLNAGGVFVFDIATVDHLARMAGLEKIVQQFGDNYLLIRVQTADGVVFEWRIEVYELQPDGRYRLLNRVVEMTSFPVSRVRNALRRWFTGIEVTGGDGTPVDPDAEDRIWLTCIKPASRPPAVAPLPGSGVARIG